MSNRIGKESLASPTVWLVVVVHLITIIGLVWSVATQYGVLRTRLESVEVLQSRQIQAQENMALALNNLAVSLAGTQAVLNERTRAVESVVSINRAAIAKQSQRIDKAEEHTKPAKSLRNLIVGK